MRDCVCAVIYAMRLGQYHNILMYTEREWVSPLWLLMSFRLASAMAVAGMINHQLIGTREAHNKVGRYDKEDISQSR